MDKIKILQFLYGIGNGIGSGDGDGDGIGNGNGSGSGYGYGNGGGYGNGNGYGDGIGNGGGSGDGDGIGNGSGYGYGNGNGIGSGDGDGDGIGNGNGDGDGIGNGNGSGSGYGYGNGGGGGSGNDFKISKYKKNQVYYSDGIPCIFVSIRNNIAKVKVIDVMTFQETDQYIYRFNGCFAHGLSIKKAKEDSERKFYSSLNTEQSIELFKKKFKKGVQYPNTDFYNWHTVLTGSCDSGKNMWVSQKGISMGGSMTPEIFVELTKDSYGGDVIKRIDLK